MEPIIKQQKLIVIAGPTACGKTAASIELAKRINGEIISADSMQVYKYMDIGTAKPTPEEMQGIKHHLIDELNPDDEYSVAVFKNMAENDIKEIAAKGKTPILCGGTGFYINALVNGNEFTQTEADYTYRDELTALAAENGPAHVHTLLKQADPEAAEAIHQNNVKRVIRALEYHNQTGTKISEHNRTEKAKKSIYDLQTFILDADRDLLYDKINLRIDLMLEKGLVKEVQSLLDMGYSENSVSMQGLGYKEIVKYIKREITFDEAVFILKRDTRHFAKRQITWFKHQLRDSAVWLNINNDAGATQLAEEMVREASY